VLPPIANGELRAADGDQPADPGNVQRYLAKAFGEDLQDVRVAMEELAGRYDPAELNRTGFRLHEGFRPDVPAGAEGWVGRRCWTWRGSATSRRYNYTSAEVLTVTGSGI